MKYSIQFIILAILIPQIVYSQEFNFTEIPKWVKTINIPDSSSVSKYEIISGYYLKLVDFQVNLENDAIFNREVRNVISYSGITEASQLSVVYDTSYQQLSIHHLYIWRKGVKMDRTSDLSFEIMNNEYSLGEGIYTGKIMAYDILNDIRKDDLIDFAYTITGGNPIFESEKYLFIPLDVMNPVDLYEVRIIYPSDRDYLYKCVGCDSLLVSSIDTNGYHQIEICKKDLKAIKIEDNIPTWTIPFRYFVLSSFNSWESVNEWAQNVFKLEEEPNLDIVFDEIFNGNETEHEKVNKIIDYVQNEIRYMGIETGIGSIKPFPPEQVVKQRYGDCKDKSLLLVSLLKKIGITNAYPALVNTNWQHKVDMHFASNQVFNHCIVTFDYDSVNYWVDPAVALQGGDFEDLYTYNYGKALVIGMPSDSLQIMNPGEMIGNTEIIEELTVKSFDEPATLKITSIRNGFEADRRRASLEYYSINDLSDMVTDDLKLLYPSVVKMGEIDVVDDDRKNSITLIYNYEVDGYWEDKSTTEREYRLFKYQPQTLIQYFTEYTCEDREFDFELIYPLELNYRMIFYLPEDILIFDDFDTFENEAFFYDENVEQLSKNSFQIDYNFRIKSKLIKVEDYKSVCEEINTIAKELSVVIYFPKQK